MRTDMTIAARLAAYVAALVAVFVLGYGLGELSGVSGPAMSPDDEMSEMTSTEHATGHRTEGT